MSRHRASLVIGLLFAAAVPAADPTYVGAAKCKLCHKVEYASWEQLAHSRAFERLTGEERQDATCLTCHATAGSADLPGVQCEACHGPGSDYKSLKVMKDPAASRAAGLLLPDDLACKKCHEKAPHDLRPFDRSRAGGVHEVKQKG